LFYLFKYFYPEVISEKIGQENETTTLLVLRALEN